MTVILSQDEIDEILVKLGTYTQAEVDLLLNNLLTPKEKPIFFDQIKGVQDLAKFLIQEAVDKNKNSFENLYVNSFQGSHITLSKQIINDVYTQSAVKEPKAIVKIGNIEIIPINICPSCKNYHYDEEVQEIYSESKPSTEFISKNEGLKEYEMIRKWKTENRTICCKKCNLYFQPTIVYSESENYHPYLCKLQTIKTLDDWFYSERTSKIELFSLKTKTIVFGKTTSLLWDVFLNESVNGIETCPQGLLNNIVRYTPLAHLEKMLNKEMGIPVFNSFDFKSYYKPTQIFEEV